MDYPLRSAIRIAHITPHLGGGVGEVIKGLFSYSKNYENSLFTLDWCNSNFENLEGAKNAIQGLSYRLDEFIIKQLTEYDIFVVHYWNHPLMADFLARICLSKSRLIFWCHNSGLYEPHIIPSYLAKLSNVILFTSECSFLAPNITEILTSNKFLNIGSVHSTRVLDNFLEIGLSRKKVNNNKKLLYVGTVSQSKLHHQSAFIFAELSKKGYTIDIVGGMDHEALAYEVHELGGKVNVHGPVDNVRYFYINADVFIYPLRSNHYGTGEQVILEAMASGLPVIAFSNPAESAIIENGVDGFLVNSTKSFIDSVGTLFQDHELIFTMGSSGVQNICKKYAIKIMLDKLEDYYLKTLEFKKGSIRVSGEFNQLESKLNLYCRNSFYGEAYCNDLGSNLQCNINTIYAKIRSNMLNFNSKDGWLAENKSTPFHYLKYFPNDKDLLLITEMISK
jgi:glycosyltransferase involved in cell wall biosynthesis